MFFEENKYLDVFRENPRKYRGPNKLFEDHFEFNSLPYSVYRRFIELLYPATNHFFRKTSKKNYQQCLDLRGIEVEDLSWKRSDASHGVLWFRNGKMRLNLDGVPTNWAKWLVATESVFIDHCDGAAPDIEKLDFVKKNTSLFFYQGFAEELEYLIHPGLETVCIRDSSLEFDHLLRCLDKLNACQRLKSIHFDNYNVESAAAFEQLKQQLEQLAGRHPQAQIGCTLGYNKTFEIHENVLCHSPEPSLFVKDYNFENLPQILF